MVEVAHEGVLRRDIFSTESGGKIKGRVFPVFDSTRIDFYTGQNIKSQST